MNSPEISFSNDITLLEKLSPAGFFVGSPNPPSDKTLKRILSNSQHIYLAIKDGQLIGFINAISDQVLSAYIPLLEVLPFYKKQGFNKGHSVMIRNYMHQSGHNEG